MPRLVNPTIFVLTAATAMTCGGCMDASTRKRVSDSGIIALVAPPSPTEAARMMADPFDADKRYKGLTWISNAPWGGADVYLRAYRDMVQNDTDVGVRAVAARALAFHGSSQDVPLILPLLRHDDRRVRQTAARALQRLYNSVAIPDLIAHVDTSDRSLVRIITTPTESEAIAARRRAFGPDKAPQIGLFAAAATASSQDQWAPQGGLVGEMGTIDNHLPPAVWTVVSRMVEGGISGPIATGPNSSGPYVVAMVEKRTTGETDHDTRQAAASALGMYADPRVLKALIYALSDDDLAVSRTARESLRTLTGNDAGNEPKDWEAWAAATATPFAGQTRYLYPNFSRGKYFWEYIPLVNPPPNEPASTPIGYRAPGT
jgi:hypothetical protein